MSGKNEKTAAPVLCVGSALRVFCAIPTLVLILAAAFLLAGCPDPSGSGTVAVTGVSLDVSTASLTVGGTGQLTATVAPADATDATMSWKSSDAAVASVSAAGLVTAAGVGTATVTVTTTDGAHAATCAVTVTARMVAVTGVSLDASTATVNIGLTRQLTATVAPADATDATMSWKCSDEAVATVGTSGLVTTVAVGTATITVTTTDGGHEATCTVTVREPDVYVGGSWGDTPKYPGYWKNGTWHDLTPTTSGKSAEVYDILVQDGVLYAAGYCSDSSDVDMPGYWKDGTWIPLPTAASGRYGYARSIVVTGGDVYLAGNVRHATGSNEIAALWKNGTLTTYEQGSYTIDVADLAVSGTDVYMAGHYYDNSVFHAGCWKNGTWTELDPLIANESAMATAVVLDGTSVIFAGWSVFDSNGRVRAVTWADGVTSSLDAVTPQESQPYAMVKSAGSLYVSGYYNKDGDSPDLANFPCYWKDGAVTFLPRPDTAGLQGGGQPSGIWLAVSGTVVYVASEVRDEDPNIGGSIPYVWRNGVRSQLQIQPGNVYHQVYGITLE